MEVSTLFPRPPPLSQSAGFSPFRSSAAALVCQLPSAPDGAPKKTARSLRNSPSSRSSQPSPPDRMGFPACAQAK
jgi:hypothetical protein